MHAHETQILRALQNKNATTRFKCTNFFSALKHLKTALTAGPVDRLNITNIKVLISLILRSELAEGRVDPDPTHLRLRLSVSLSGIGLWFVTITVV